MPEQLEIIPISDHVCVRQHAAAEKVGRIWIAEQAQDPPLLGDVLSVGPEVKQVEIGMTVVFARYTGVNVHLNDEQFLMMREEEILAIVK